MSYPCDVFFSIFFLGILEWFSRVVIFLRVVFFPIVVDCLGLSRGFVIFCLFLVLYEYEVPTGNAAFT